MSHSERVFPLAPMSTVFWVLTLPLLALAPLFLVLSLKLPVLLWPGLLVFGMDLGVWLFMRPSAFVLTPDALELRFPFRRWVIARAGISGARVIERADLRNELGKALRVGVGGLFGTFGLLWTSKRGWVSCYVSRVEGVALIERRDGRSLLITPEAPHELARLLRDEPPYAS